MLGHLVSNALHDGPSRQPWNVPVWLRRLLALFNI
jgi:hypothetical protein